MQDQLYKQYWEEVEHSHGAQNKEWDIALFHYIEGRVSQAK